MEINENLIKALVEQAKNEGIVPIENEESDEKLDTEPSFYEQALSVLKEKPPILKDFNIELDIDYQFVEANKNENDSVKLPKLDISQDEPSNKIKIRRQIESANLLNSRASSAAGEIETQNTSFRESAAPSPSQSFLPKIDSRFLPNNNPK